MKKHIDKRGMLQELYRDSESFKGFCVKQVSLCTINPGEKRGGHYHMFGTEAFIILEGEMILSKKYIGFPEKGTEEFLMTSEINTIQYNVPLEWHEVSSEKGCKFLIVQNWEYDPENPDTYTL